MTRREIIDMFRGENRDITSRVADDTVLGNHLKIGNQDFCIRTKCIRKDDTIQSVKDVRGYDLTARLSDFYSIDELSGGGVAYDDDRLDERTIARLDQERSRWRTEGSGTPEYYYRQMNILNLVPTPGTSDKDIVIHYISLPDDFNDDNLTPFNELQYLESFHYVLVKYLEWKMMPKIGKRQDAAAAREEYLWLTRDARKQIVGSTFGPTYFSKKILKDYF